MRLALETGNTTNLFLQRLSTGPPILADGAMGTQLYERLGHRYVCFEELNVTNPQLVQAVHRSYIEAGAELIETNTFACNRFLLRMRGLEAQVERFAQAGARVAREAQEAMAVDVFVAGSIGPLNRTLGVSQSEMRDAFREVVEGLLLGGVDLLLLETFGSLEELVLAVEVCRDAADLPLVASMTFTEDGRSLGGDEPSSICDQLKSAGVEVIGANCGFGPQPTFEVINAMLEAGAPALSAMPNAGLPARRDGRLVYTAGPEYFAEYAARMKAAGVRLIGGCCGTTAAHIRRMHETLLGSQAASESVGQSRAFAIDPRWEQPVPTLPPTTSRLQEAFDRGEFVISVEVRPSRGANPGKVVRAAENLARAGVTALDVTDSALGRVRMSAFTTAFLIQQSTGIEVVAHVTTRDRNLMALQADLLGAHALGIRNLLALTGDPPNSNSWAPTTGVYDVDSIGLTTLITRLNKGFDAAGTSIGGATAFLTGCSFNPTADDLQAELERLSRKVEAGARFIVTQAVFDADRFLAAYERIRAFDLPILLELLPLQSFKNAEFIHNELPGVTLPVAVLERMRNAGAKAADEGMTICRELFAQLSPLVQGIYIVPSFDRYEQAAQLTREFRSRLPLISQARA